MLDPCSINVGFSDMVLLGDDPESAFILCEKNLYNVLV